MGRNKSNKVDYFPHVAKPGKTLFILEGRWGNDGYAFWFKLLEILADSEGHFYDASQPSNWHYLVSRFRITEISATEMLNLVADLGNINKQLWKRRKIIWCQALVDNLAEVYRKRKRNLPSKPPCNLNDKHSWDENPTSCDNNGFSVADMPPDDQTLPRKHSCDRIDDFCDIIDFSDIDIQTADCISATAITQSKVKESKGEENKEFSHPVSKDGIALPAPLPSPAEIAFTCKHFTLSKAYFDELLTDYPGFTSGTLLHELKKARDWLDGNPNRHKRNARGELKVPGLFLRNWLKRATIEPETRTSTTRNYGFDGEPEWMKKRFGES